MIVQAIKEGGADSTELMVGALEGFTFDGPKGKETIRATDHVLEQNMYQAKLVQKAGAWTPELVAVIPADEVAPPEKR